MSINFKEDYNKIKFSCQKCKRCCQSSSIRLSPYDILKLCKFHGISTTEFHQKYSYFILDQENQDLLTCMLKTDPECSYLTEEGCQVYEDRPFGCRTFPLAIQPFFDGQKVESKYYVLEECAGFDCNKKITLGEFKEEQGVTKLLSIQEEWVKFKIKVINSQINNKEKFNQVFYDICYDFDGEYFRQILKEKGLVWPDSMEDKFKLVMKLAEELLI